MEKVQVYLPPKLVKELEKIKNRDQDDSIGSVARRLIKKALTYEKIEEE